MNDVHAAGGAEGDVTAGMVRVVRGVPDDVELAALVAGIVAARTATADVTSSPASSPWNDHGRRLGRRHVPGATAWRWSLQR